MALSDPGAASDAAPVVPGRIAALPGAREMRTVRSLLERGLVRPRRRGRADVGLWFLSAKGGRILPDPEAADAPAAPARRGRARGLSDRVAS